FAFVRNPWARTVSAFVSKIITNQPQAAPVLAHFEGRWTPSDWRRVVKHSQSRWFARFRPPPPSPEQLNEGEENPARMLMTFRDFVEYLESLDLNQGSPRE